MASEGKTTTNHEEIRQWVEQRGGRPARVKGTGDDGEGGLLRINFPDYGGEGRLEDISWDEFFEAFEESRLAFLYQDRTAGGKESRFSKLVRREH